MSITEETKEQAVGEAPITASSTLEPIVHPTSLEGLLQLRQAGLLRHDTDLVEGQQHFCSTWSHAVRFEEDNTTTTTPVRIVVTHLDLGGCRLHRGLPEGILSVLQQNLAHTVTSLNLGGTDLPVSETRQVLQMMSNLEALHLGANGLGDIGVTALSEWLATAPHLTTLDLRYNDIGSLGCEALCTGLRQQKEFLLQHQQQQQSRTNTTAKKGVTKLYLEGNDLQDAGAAAFATHYQLGLTDSPLQELFLGANQIGAPGATSLAQCLVTNQTLSKLYLEGNHIGVEGADAFTRVLIDGRGRTGLQHLFCDNNNIGKEGSKRLAAALNSGTAIGDSL